GTISRISFAISQSFGAPTPAPLQFSFSPNVRDNRRAVERKPSHLPVGQFSGDAPARGSLAFCPSGSSQRPSSAKDYARPLDAGSPLRRRAETRRPAGRSFTSIMATPSHAIAAEASTFSNTPAWRDPARSGGRST